MILYLSHPSICGSSPLVKFSKTLFSAFMQKLALGRPLPRKAAPRPPACPTPTCTAGPASRPWRWIKMLPHQHAHPLSIALAFFQGYGQKVILGFEVLRYGYKGRKSRSQFTRITSVAPKILVIHSRFWPKCAWGWYALDVLANATDET